MPLFSLIPSLPCLRAHAQRACTQGTADGHGRGSGSGSGQMLAPSRHFPTRVPQGPPSWAGAAMEAVEPVDSDGSGLGLSTLPP